jgi:hypothetical protein
MDLARFGIELGDRRTPAVHLDLREVAPQEVRHFFAQFVLTTPGFCFTHAPRFVLIALRLGGGHRVGVNLATVGRKRSTKRFGNPLTARLGWLAVVQKALRAFCDVMGTLRVPIYSRELRSRECGQNAERSDCKLEIYDFQH